MLEWCTIFSQKNRQVAVASLGTVYSKWITSDSHILKKPEKKNPTKNKSKTWDVALPLVEPSTVHQTLIKEWIQRKLIQQRSQVPYVRLLTHWAKLAPIQWYF